ncbi:NfeD family protein [bacterium 1xD8-6]|nr:NfeD family protein [bacterium D16-36]RKI67725.1 NfeD family protein [bacterium 1xD8-6]
MQPIYWLIVVAVLLVLEILTLGLTTIWFAGGAFVAFLAGICQAPLWIQILLFLVVSIILLVFTRPIAEKHLNNSREKTNVDSLVGKHGRVLEEIDNFNQTGRVMLNGMEWTARNISSERKIPAGTKVEVMEIKGAHLVVQEWR